ncbi:MAG: NYN domain-containing protein [Candidatus Saccharimonadales bacterium]
MKRNIYIDGENLVHIVVDCLISKKLIKNRRDLQDFDFGYLIDFVTRVKPHKATKTRYYGAKLQVFKGNSRLEKNSKDMVRWNSNWINVLQKQKIEFIKCGHLKLRDSHKCNHCGKTNQIFLEKGVDVGLAVDVVSDALKGHVNEIVLFSADSDMLPAIKRAHGAGVRVVYAAYSGAMNRALTTMADDVWTFSEEQIVEAFKRNNK